MKKLSKIKLTQRIVFMPAAAGVNSTEIHEVPISDLKSNQKYDYSTVLNNVKIQGILITNVAEDKVMGEHDGKSFVLTPDSTIVSSKMIGFTYHAFYYQTLEAIYE